MKARYVVALCVGFTLVGWAAATASTMRLWVSIPLEARGAKL